MTTRLSRKAQELASEKAARLDQAVREYASSLAEYDGREFAEEKDVEAAYQYVIKKLVERLGSMKIIPG